MQPQQERPESRVRPGLRNCSGVATQRNILSILDDRLAAQQQLVTLYVRWGNQVELQHKIMLHLMLQSLTLIATIVLLTILAGWGLQAAFDRMSRDRRQRQTLRIILNLGTQVIGLLLVLLVIFGTPQQMPTILGLATAGLTVVFQDFILAFCGWFVLMGRNGIRVGDWVEIDGVGGEVVEIGVFRTWLLETGNWTANGHPTGRRVSFLNGYAIHGKYFNFSTAGQWMWDEIKVSIPPGTEAYPLIDKDPRSRGQGDRGGREDGGRGMETRDPRRGFAAVQCDAFGRYAAGGLGGGYRGALRNPGRGTAGDAQPAVWDGRGANDGSAGGKPKVAGHNTATAYLCAAAVRCREQHHAEAAPPQ